MRAAGDIEDAAEKLRSLANRLRSGSTDPDQAAAQMRRVANELDDLVRRVKRLAREARE